MEKLQVCSNRLVLRALEKSDVDTLHIWENDMSLWDVSGYTTPFSKEALTEFVEQSSKAQSIYSSGQLRLIIEVDDVAVGCIDMFDFSPKDKRVGVGILIYNKENHRRGYAFLALQEALNYMRKVLGVENIWAHIPLDNIASRRLFEKSEFQLIGVLKRWILFDNRSRDVGFYQLLK